MLSSCSILRLLSCGCAVLGAGILHASGLQPWLRELSGIPLPASAEGKNQWMQNLWTRTAEQVASLSDPAAADDCGDAMALLAPVFQAWPDGRKPGPRWRKSFPFRRSRQTPSLPGLT